jgi:hypothetical protein
MNASDVASGSRIGVSTLTREVPSIPSGALFRPANALLLMMVFVATIKRNRNPTVTPPTRVLINLPFS